MKSINNTRVWRIIKLSWLRWEPKLTTLADCKVSVQKVMRWRDSWLEDVLNVEGKQWLKAVKLWTYSKINVEVKPRDALRRARMVIK